jgi:hypothetical protein
MFSSFGSSVPSPPIGTLLDTSTKFERAYLFCLEDITFAKQGVRQTVAPVVSYILYPLFDTVVARLYAYIILEATEQTLTKYLVSVVLCPQLAA